VITISSCNPKGFQLTGEVYNNLQSLAPLINEVEEGWIALGGASFVISTGYRTREDHERIYAEINAGRAKQGLKPLRIPYGSQHLKGNAVDISDPGQKLAKYLLANLKLLEGLGLYMEEPSRTSHPAPWVHLQRVAPASGNRVFLP
jgi:hypothetical protein